MNETWIKATMYSIYASLIALFEFLWLPAFQVGVLWILMIFDVITWVLKQRIIKPQNITSNRLTVWILAKILTLICVLLIALCIKAVWFDFAEKNYLQIALSFLIWWELYSVIANTISFKTKKDFGEFDAITVFLSWFANLIKEYLHNFFEHKDK